MDERGLSPHETLIHSLKAAMSHRALAPGAIVSGDASSSRDPWHRYAAALAAVAIATVARKSLDPLVGLTLPFIFSIPAVFFAAWFGGIGPGLFATGLSIAASIHWILAPAQSSADPARADMLGLCLFGLIGVAFSWLIESSRRKTTDLAIERAELRRLLEGAPSAIGAYEGKNHTAVLSNLKHEEMTWGRVVIGKSLLECMPELAGQAVVQLLDEAYQTGEPTTTREVAVQLMRRGFLQDCWFDVALQPTRDPQGQVTGVRLSAVDVTAHVLTRHGLELTRAAAEAANRFTQSITSNASLGLVMIDARQHCSFMNPAAEKIFGYTLAEVQAMNRPFHDIVHHTRPDGSRYPMEECPIDRVLPARNHGEDVFVHRDGSFYFVSFTASPLLESGVPRGTIIEVEDITERKRAEERLRVSERKFSALFEKSAFAICLVKMPSTVIADVNPAWVELFGYSKEEAVGTTSVELGLSMDLEARDRIKQEFQSRGFVRNMESKVLTRKGRFLTISNNLDSVEFEGQRYLVGTFQDVTEQREAEKAIRESERQFHDLIDNLPELAWSAQPDGHIDFYNRRWYEYTGTTFEQMEGWGWKSVHDPQMLGQVVEKWTRSVTTGESFEMEFPLRGADGVFRWFLTRVCALRGPSGRIVRWFGTNANVDERRKASAEREDLLGKLQRALEIRDEFLSIASHELRTPLTALQLQIQGTSHLLQKTDGNDTAKLLRKLETANRQTERLTRMVDGLLEVSRNSLGRLSLDLEDVDLVSVVREVLEHHEILAHAAGCMLSLDAEAPVVGRWDRLRLEQVATNLLSNAIKYGPGRPIDISVRVGGDFAVFTVQDRGMGIRAEDLARVFGKFERAVPSRHYGGWGLGLYITREIAEALGGQIDVTSAIGQGSTFKITLPFQHSVSRDQIPKTPDAHS